MYIPIINELMIFESALNGRIFNGKIDANKWKKNNLLRMPPIDIYEDEHYVIYIYLYWR